MNVTFMIGNGFDLRMGMKTRFADMYEEYVFSDSVSDNISRFKSILKEDAPKYKTWGDFEMAMAQQAKKFESEEAFIECLRDFKRHMAMHLQREQEIFIEKLQRDPALEGRCIEEMNNSFKNFYGGLTPNVVNVIERLRGGYSSSYQLLTFNYTSTFEYLMPSFPREVIHVHGALNEGASVGVDNIEQLTGLSFTPTKRFLRAFIKPEFNASYNNARLQKAEKIIDDSDVICVYGMSLGLSDLSWATKLRNWLLSDKHHHLVYFVYDEREFNKFNWDEIMDEEEDRIAMLLGKLCENSADMDNIFNQIHIPVGYDIFNIATILKDAEDAALCAK